MRSCRVVLSTFLGLLGLGLGLGSCGKATDGTDLLLDSNTNWLKRCDQDSECSGSLRCYCGQCTQPCAGLSECSLLSGASCSASGPALCGDQAGAGGLCVKECTGDGDCATDFSCNAEQCVPQPAPTDRPCIVTPRPSWDDLLEAIARDVSQLDTEDALFARYFTVANRWRAPGCESSFDPDRLALGKLLNGLSNNARLNPPEAVDPARTLYRIDQRNYDWNQLVTVGSQTFPDVWEALIAHDPFALSFVGDAAGLAEDATGTDRPLMFVSAFVAAGTRSDVYYGLLRIPASLPELLDELDIGGEFPDAPLAQVGFAEGDREFVGQTWEQQVRAGHLWQVREFGRGPGALFEDPLEPPLGQRELIFTLPNSLQAYAFMTPDGQRLDQWQATVDLAERDGVARAPRSNLRRHTFGVALRDEVREFLAQNPERFDSNESLAIQARYGSGLEFEALLRQHNSATTGALGNLGIDPTLQEPITFVFDAFDRDLSLADAAGDLLTSEDELLDGLPNLSPALSVLDGGSISRADFARVFVATTCIMTVVLENQVDVAACEEAL